jgi:hypothetical protein
MHGAHAGPLINRSLFFRWRLACHHRLMMNASKSILCSCGRSNKRRLARGALLAARNVVVGRDLVRLRHAPKQKRLTGGRGCKGRHRFRLLASIRTCLIWSTAVTVNRPPDPGMLASVCCSAEARPARFSPRTAPLSLAIIGSWPRGQ